jgi:uncharacterized protein (TIGR02466 family)
VTQSGPFDAIRMRAEQVGLFETPVLHGRLQNAAELIAGLKAAVDRRRAEQPGIGRSNVGGWHSSTDMLDWGGAAAAKLADFATRACARMSHMDGGDARQLPWHVRMWANVSPPGALNMSHAHPGVLWAAVFYVDMGRAEGNNTEPGGGELFFEDPRFPVPLMRLPGFRLVGVDGQPQPVERRLRTEAGDLVIFPAWLRHGVSPHTGGGDRMSVAMNIDVKAG